MLNNIVKRKTKIIAGTSHHKLAYNISEKLDIKLTPTTIDAFANTEIRVEIHENIRGDDVFIIQTGCTNNATSINDYIMETMLLIDACKRSHANTITLILPNYPYARADKKDRPRVPISAKVVANMVGKL